ncbi:hypothetical protein FHG71_00775 [Rubellimicrobium roseum]|uniref:Calcium-binding protein n=2 Tax=Rubellimicrobium roseum TaxID=687525 RepID=A0A5C4NPK6_9RHOB|nr:hypothetical protein FHG71_00775 [Rubellimicrobium roseum]
MTLTAGRRYYFDADDITNGNDVNLEVDLIDSAGRRVASSDPATAGADPNFSFVAASTGVFFVAVHQSATDYVNGGFRFIGQSADLGDYAFNVSTSFQPEQFILSGARDERTFNDLAQRVLALGGNDEINGRGGNDVLVGGSGNDQLRGGSGGDELVGGSGNDRLRGETGEDALVGGIGNDLLYGGADGDDLQGGGGSDLLLGERGADTIWGGSGADDLYGGDGSDLLRGGLGLDLLYGGGGADTFHFLPGEAPASDRSIQDRIEDFSELDVIDFGDLILGQLGFGGSGRNTVRVVELTSGYFDVRVNLDGDSASELEILVDTIGGFRPDRSDFIL